MNTHEDNLDTILFRLQNYANIIRTDSIARADFKPVIELNDLAVFEIAVENFKSLNANALLRKKYNPDEVSRAYSTISAYVETNLSEQLHLKSA